MIDAITELEKAAMELEPSSSVRQTIAKLATDYVDGYVGGIRGARTLVHGDQSALKALEITEEPKPINTLMEVFDREVNGTGINASSGGHMGYIPGGGVWTSAIGDLLAAGTNRYSGVFYSSPGAVILENQLLKWMCSMVGFPKSAHGNITSGGSIANLIAVQVAREAKQINSTNVRNAVVYFSGQAHHCIHKAFRTTGLNEAVHREIPMNDKFQMNADVLEETIRQDKAQGLRPFLVVASAGTTDTGAIDPIDRIADVCKAADCWFHLDAAYGGFFILVEEIRKKFKGIERADSVVMDPHKSLFIPYGIGVVLVRNGDQLVSTYSHQAAYMQDTYGFDEISPADCGPELSRHFRGMRLWLPLHLHGLKPFRATLAEKLLLSRYFRKRIADLGFETGPEPDLSVTLFRYPAKDKNGFNQKLVDAIHSDGRCFFSSTVINGELWIRAAILNFRTHLFDVDRGVEMISDCLGKIVNR